MYPRVHLGSFILACVITFSLTSLLIDAKPLKDNMKGKLIKRANAIHSEGKQNLLSYPSSSSSSASSSSHDESALNSLRDTSAIKTQSVAKREKKSLASATPPPSNAAAAAILTKATAALPVLNEDNPLVDDAAATAAASSSSADAAADYKNNDVDSDDNGDDDDSDADNAEIRDLLEAMVEKILNEKEDEALKDERGGFVISAPPDERIDEYDDLDGFSASSSSSSPLSLSPSSSSFSSPLYKLWLELKSDASWEARVLEEEFIKIEEAILRRIQRIMMEGADNDVDTGAEEMARKGEKKATPLSQSKLVGELDQRRRQRAEKTPWGKSGAIKKKDDDDDNKSRQKQQNRLRESRKSQQARRLPNRRDHHGFALEKNAVRSAVSSRRVRWSPTEKEMALFLEKNIRRGGRGKRNLLTDLIQPHMQWEQPEAGGAAAPEMTYAEFKVVAEKLVAQLKKDRELVTGQERETADAVISTLELLLAGGEDLFRTLVD